MSPSNTSPRKSRRSAAASAAALVVVAAAAMALPSPPVASAFAAPRCRPPPAFETSSASASSALHAEPTGRSRREALRAALGLAAGLAASSVAAFPDEARASYSAYASRERDWQERNEKGEIQYSNARDLRAQLRDIVPQNSESSKVFCPNGPSAAVSPLMENKCGDRLAMPSVYGRTQDAAGNSVPGFAGGKYPAAAPGGGGASPTAEMGGFPAYKAF